MNLIRRGQTWTHRIEGTRAVIINFDDETIVDAIVFSDTPGEWMRVAFDHDTFLEQWRWQP